MNTHSLRFRVAAWYAAVLAVTVVLFGFAVYMGLGRYLEQTLRTSLRHKAKDVALNVAKVPAKGEPWFANEMNEDFDNNKMFLRVSRQDGSVLYQSIAPADKGFDPQKVPRISGQVEQDISADRTLPDARRLIVEAMPVTTPDGKRFLVETGALFQPIEHALHGLVVVLAVGLPFILACAIAGGYLLMYRALYPVNEIARQAEQITSRNLSERLPVLKTGDELERLSTALNRMIARLDEAFQHINRFSADVSHELRTPLTILRGELEYVTERQRLAPEVLDTLGSALEEIDRLTKIVENLLAISRVDAGETRMEQQRIDLADLASTTAEQMQLLADEKLVSLRYRLQPGIRVQGDPSRLRQILVNLLDNAIRYTGEEGWVEIAVYTQAGNAILEVSDNGAGISAESLPHLFERFYRADKARSRYSGGAGLGLSIVKSICVAHGGNVSVSSQEGRGSTFRVELPLATGAVTGQTPAPPPKIPSEVHEAGYAQLQRKS
ncbi:MAG TPA: heavy metal sensor histidine kinase [Terriglobales bacterium]|nr:heavy metal sensor histidine kinase [Terriglobales bacterium]